MSIIEAICAEFNCEEADIYFHTDDTFEVTSQLGEYRIVELPQEDQQEFRFACFRIA